MSLTPLGVVFGHQLAYAIPHSEHPAGNAAAHAAGHLGPLGAVGLPLALISAARLLRRTSADRALPSISTVVIGQVLAFALLESTEGLLHGGHLAELARSPVLWIGLVIQAGVAAFVVTGLRASRMVLGSLLLRRLPATPEVLSPAPSIFPATAPAPRPPEATRWLLGRGPPVLPGF